MKTKLGFALLALMFLGLLGGVLAPVNASAVASSAGARSSQSLSSSGANPSNSPLNTASSSGVPAASLLNVLRPENWISPINVTHNPDYDNGPGTNGIAASQLNGSVVIG